MVLSARKLMILLLIIFVSFKVSKCEVYKIGGSSSWTHTGNFDYKSWAASKTFHVGDTIVFEYNKKLNNVVRVTHKNFNSCNSTAPDAIWATGNETFVIKRPTHMYFICSIPGRCEAGQKVDIRVTKPNVTNPVPLSRPDPIATAPGKSSAAVGLYASWKLCALVIAFIVNFIAF